MKQFSIFNSDSIGINFQFSKRSGFTLVEMLAVVSIFIVIGAVGVSILSTSFRTSTKTDTITVIQQNGNYALTQMSKTLRNARGLVTPFPCYPSLSTSSITVVTPDDNKITFSCIPISTTPATIASNGASLLDTNSVTLIDCKFTCSQTSKSDLPIVSINFSLQQQTNSKFAEFLASNSAIPFQTSIGIRNINR